MYRTDTDTNAMNAHRCNRATAIPAPRNVRYRSRDFGIGYGNSSGYASGRCYIPASQPASRFRLV